MKFPGYLQELDKLLGDLGCKFRTVGMGRAGVGAEAEKKLAKGRILPSPPLPSPLLFIASSSLLPLPSPPLSSSFLSLFFLFSLYTLLSSFLPPLPSFLPPSLPSVLLKQGTLICLETNEKS